MGQFVEDFGIFFNKILSCIITFWNWLLSTTLGEIILFIVIISLFFFILNLIINFKN